MSSNKFNRREFLQAGAAAAAGLGLSSLTSGARGQDATLPPPHTPAEPTGPNPVPRIVPRADSIIYIWLPGGVAQTDTFDPKKYTPFRPGMHGNELLGTC